MSDNPTSGQIPTHRFESSPVPQIAECGIRCSPFTRAFAQPLTHRNITAHILEDGNIIYAKLHIQLPDPEQPVTADTFTFSLRRDKLRTVRRREGRYLLRSNLPNEDPATLWQYYIRLTEIEQAFKELKHDLAIRPIHHQLDRRIEAHILVAFIAYCLHVTLKQRTRSCEPGLTPRAVLEKFATVQMVDVHLPTTDGRQLILPRYTQPDPDH